MIHRAHVEEILFWPSGRGSESRVNDLYGFEATHTVSARFFSAFRRQDFYFTRTFFRPWQGIFDRLKNNYLLACPIPL
jgi:hypothetical protein